MDINSVLKFYYDLQDIDLKIRNEGFIIKKNKSLYYFYPVHYDKNNLYEFYRLNRDIIKINPNSSEIVLNKFGDSVTLFQNKNYVLVRIGINYYVDIDSLDLNKYKLLYRNMWDELWEKKIDYLEYQYSHIKGKNLELNQYFDFFCGLTENAISLYKSFFSQYGNVSLFLQHKRYNSFFYNDPFNLVIDYRVRDVAETIKYKFFEDELDNKNIDSYIKHYKFSKSELYLLYVRLLYPSIYFDVYEKIINSEDEDRDYSSTFNKFSKYLFFIEFVNSIDSFDFINDKISWLKKS